ncbi:MAG: glycosyltransferase [Mobilicoccus sp.]|nr:glycosyltransferase [Mobilicoccus sp.]
MALVLLALGSRGDLTPLLALAREATARGAEVRVVALDEYAPLIAAAGAEHVPVHADVAGAMWHPHPVARRMMLAQPGLMYAGMTLRLGRAAPLVVDAVRRATRPGDTVVAGLATSGIAVELAARHRVVLALFAPVLPTAHPASAVMACGLGRHRLSGSPTRVTSSVGWTMSVEMSGAAGRRWRRESAAPPGVDARDLTAVRAAGLRILLAADPALVPPAPDWPVGVRQTGFWTMPSGDPEVAQVARLEAFLARGSAPVFVGFGTCPVVDPQADLDLFVRAAERAGVRIVVQPQPGVQVPESPGVVALGEFPHDRLFPRLAGVVHHGGAGTTSAAVQAGVPSAVIPHLGDQGYWGRRVADLGLGPSPVPRTVLTEGSLARVLRGVTGERSGSYARQARQIGDRMRTDGAEHAAALILDQSAVT